jgi:hypothetical protein
VAGAIHQAIAAAYAGRGVARLTLPQDVIAAKAENGVSSVATLKPRPEFAANDADITELVRRIDQAGSVVIMCEAGCHGAARELRALSDRLKAPLIHSLRAKDIMPYDDLRWMGGSGARTIGAFYRSCGLTGKSQGRAGRLHAKDRHHSQCARAGSSGCGVRDRLTRCFRCSTGQLSPSRPALNPANMAPPWSSQGPQKTVAPKASPLGDCNCARRQQRPAHRKSKVHVAHASTRWHRRRFRLWLFGDHRGGGHQQTGDRGRTLRRCPHDLGRVDDAGPHQILELAGLRLEAPVVLVRIE